MSRMAHRSVRSLLAAAATLSGVAVSSAIASDTGDLDGASDMTPVSASAVLDRAAELLAAGESVRARAMLIELSKAGDAAGLTPEESVRKFTLLKESERALRDANKLDVSLQKAELTLLQDNLVQAERHASVARRSTRATEAQRARAEAVLGLIHGRRAALADEITALATEASQAFEAGRYPEAKAGLIRVQQSGVELERHAKGTVESYLRRIVELEDLNGEAFRTPAAMSVLGASGPIESSWILGQPERTNQRAGAFLMDAVRAGQDDQPAGDGDAAVGADQPAGDPVELARRFQASSLLAEADRDYDDRRLGDALAKYQRVLTEFASYLSAEDLDHARRRLDDTRVRMGVQQGPRDQIGEDIESRDLRRQRALASFNSNMEQADQDLRSGNTSAARSKAISARLAITAERAVFSEARVEELLRQADLKLAEIDQAERDIDIAERRDRERDLEEARQRIQEQERNTRDARVNELIDRVRSLQAEMKYEEALGVVEQILVLDPINPSGLLLQDIIEDTLIYRRFYELNRSKNLRLAHESLANVEAIIPPEGLVNYPDDWPELSFRRTGEPQFAESAVNRAVLSTLDDSRIPVNFDAHPLEDVLAFIEATVQVDMDVDWVSLEDIGVEPDAEVSLRLNNPTVATVLDKILSKVSDPDLPAGWAVNEGVLTVASDEVLRRNTVLEIYDIQDLIFEVPDYDEAPEFDLQSVLQSSQGGGGGQSPFSNTDSDVERIPREERIQAILDIVQQQVDPDGWASVGGDTNTVQELNGNLIITATPKNHRAISGLLNKLREVRAVQINVEARFLLVNQNFFEQIGFDIDVYWNLDSTQFSVAQAVDPSVTADEFFDPETGRLRNAEIVGGGSFGVDTDGDGTIDEIAPIQQPPIASNVFGDDFSVIRTAQNSFGITESLATEAASSFVADILAANPALGITGRFLDDIQVDFLVEATQADQRSVTLTAPRLTFTNGQIAYIYVATQTAFVSGLTAVVSDSSAAFDPTVSVANEGVRLVIEGVASADRRYVTMNVETQIAELIGFEEATVTAIAGGEAVDSGDTGSTVQLPISTVTGLATTVTVPDQGTILLGGQRIVNEIEIESGVPVLSKIPILSRFFSNRIDVREESTLLVLIKPTILIQNEEEEKNFPGLLDQLPR